jgi:hypothetical protein
LLLVDYKTINRGLMPPRRIKMKTSFYLVLVNDRNNTVAELGPFKSRQEMVQVRTCVTANMGMRFVPTERVFSMMEEEVLVPLEGEFNERDARF